ncbi:MAG TPA: FAD binding domain-containing protein [Dongiaceae bacterium]|nr:FAD binding domain-containing protein [Dongiaceae bacterium]
MTAAAYFRPTALPEALAALGNENWSIIAGGTDFYPARLGRPMTEPVLDISGLADLREIRRDGGFWRIGALATWTDLIAASHLSARFDGLRQAARAVGGAQIQNVATICGNLCNASPAADGIPNLLALDAQVELRSQAGKRLVAAADFVTGNRRTVRKPHEIVTGLLVPENDRPSNARFLKLGARRYLVISIAMIGAVIEWTAEEKTAARHIAAARVAIGACGPVAQRLPLLEQALAGCAANDDLAALVQPDHLAGLTPIDDVRGTAEYRREAALILLRRLLSELRP